LYQFLTNPDTGLWIEKKSVSNQGRGIKMISDVKTYKKEKILKPECQVEMKDSNTEATEASDAETGQKKTP
jgi:hypothetical protein